MSLRNFASFFDPIAGILRRFGKYANLSNRRLLGGGFISGHITYERSRVFVRELVYGITGSRKIQSIDLYDRTKGFLLLLAESTIAPLGLGIVVFVGFIFSYIAAAFLPFIIYQIARLPLIPDMSDPMLDRLIAIFFAFFLVLVLISDRAEASKYRFGDTGNESTSKPQDLD